MADKCATLKRTIISTHAIRDAGSQVQSSNDSFIDRLTTELTAQESDISTLAECLPSTSTFLRGWETVKNAAIALQEALAEQLGSINQHATAVEEELEITKELNGHMSHSIGAFSTTIEKVQKDIVARSKGFLHPIRRLPAEILQQIFEECVDDEAAEWFVDPTRPPTILQSATRIAGTCRSWRTIAQQAPRMWNRLRAPRRVEISRRKKTVIYRTVGQEAFCGSLCLCGSIPLEVTIPENVSTLETLTSLKIDRLNFYHFPDYNSWPSLALAPPSPRHLWVGNGDCDYSYLQMLPSSLIAHTTTITVHNITVTIPEGSNLVTQLVLCGKQNGFGLTSLLESLPYLTQLDASRALVLYQSVLGHRALTHQKLNHLRIPTSCVYVLEESLAGGLQLPSLNCFGLANHSESELGRDDPLHYTPSSFPSMSSQLPITVTHLEVHGEHAVTPSSASSLIETFYKIDTVSTYGSAVGAILLALCRTGDMPEGEKPCAKGNLPRSIQVLHIHDYLGDGEDLYPALYQIYNDTEPIKIFFENCPNILPTIRRKFTHVGTTDARLSH